MMVVVGGIAVCLAALTPNSSNAAPVLDALYAGSTPGGALQLTFALNSGNPILAQTFYVVPAASGT